MHCRRLVIAMCLVLSASVAAEDLPSAKDEPVIEVSELPQPKELLDWLPLVRRKDFVLLKATRQNGYFSAFFKTADGDLAVCEYRFSGEPEEALGGERDDEDRWRKWR